LEARAARGLQRPGGGPARAVRLHRGFLQPEAAPLVARLPIARAVRERCPGQGGSMNATFGALRCSDLKVLRCSRATNNYRDDKQHRTASHDNDLEVLEPQQPCPQKRITPTSRFELGWESHPTQPPAPPPVATMRIPHVASGRRPRRCMAAVFVRR